MTHNHPLAVPERHFLVYFADNINAVGDLASDTARTLWEGLHEEAAAQNCDLLAVVGGGYRKDFGSLIYDLIVPETADGFLAWIVEAEQRVDEFFAKFTDSKLISISRQIGAHPIVAEENLSVMKALTQHLVQVHGLRRIGFIRGPQHHPYAEVRARACLEAQTELGLELDPRRVTPPGAWDWQTGVDGIRYLLDEQKLVIGQDIDAVMCASDRIAMGVFDELKRRNIRVPDDLAVTGFNNLLEAQSHTPSLTTVAVHFQRKSCQAVRMLAANLRGEYFSDAPDYLDPVVTIGESCGCHNQRLNDICLSAGEGGGKKTFSDAELDYFSAELNLHFRSLRASLSVQDRPSARLVRAFVAVLDEGAGPEEFIDLLLQQIKVGHYAFMDQMRWQDVLTIFRKMLHNHPRSTENTLRIEAMLDRARLAVMDGFSRGQTEFRLLELRQSSLMRQLGSRLGFLSDVETIMDALSQDMPRLGIASCWLAVFDGACDPDLMHAPEYAHLLLAIEGGARCTLPERGLRFPARQLLPDGVVLPNRRRTFIMFPLAHGLEEYGYIIFEQGPIDGAVYEALAYNIGSALKSAFLRQELEKRSFELELSIFELGRARNKLVENEKMAALGELVAGIAHEINTPVGIGVTAVSTMVESVKRLRQALELRSGRAIRAETDMLEEGADIALRNLYRANELIESFKQIAVDQSYEERRTFDLGAYLHDITRSLEPRLRPSRHEVQIHCPNPVALTSYPGAVSQIMSNLILNSVIHGFDGRQNGLIQISCRQVDHQAELEYRDNGIGMEPAVLEKIFHPFFTTKRGQGGTGLGMNIAYNLVTQKLGGSIECESQPGAGVRFMIRVPLEQ